ncbi:MAG TPA: lysophospholipase [Chitinophagales bacterium]|nr:lysophospholipase [Chitinophagales bacterium]
MNHFEWNWEQEGRKIFAQGWSPPQTKGVVCIVHGFNEHSTRYARAAEALCNAGYAVLTYDQFGHGKTEGKRGHAPSYDAMLDSIKILLDEAGTRFPGVRKYLWGHSMGGGEVINFLLRRSTADLNGAIATGPLLRLGFEPPAFKVFLARIMQNIYPAFTEKAELDADGISRDKEEVRKYNADPYNHGKITAGMFFGFYNAGRYALEHAAELKTPLLLMHGAADRLTSPGATKEFADKAPQNLVTLKLWDGFYHELHNEPEPDRTEVMNFIIKWLNDRALYGA